MEFDRYDARPGLKDIRVPTLIVQGREDRVFTVPQAEELRDGIPGSRLLVFEDCGHWPFVERRSEFVAGVNDFLGLANSRRSPTR